MTTDNMTEFFFTRNCVMCNNPKAFLVDKEGYIEWLAGKNIQDVLPELDENQREMMRSGICENCWEKMYGDI